MSTPHERTRRKVLSWGLMKAGTQPLLEGREGAQTGTEKLRSNISCFRQNHDTENRLGYGKLQLAGVSFYTCQWNEQTPRPCCSAKARRSAS